MLAQLQGQSLDDYLRRHVEGFSGLRALEKFADGQSNPTFLVVANSGHYVLRRRPAGHILKSAHAIDREFRVLRALHGGVVPVPRPVHYCSDHGVIGSEFYLMDYVHGRRFVDPQLPGLSNEIRSTVYDAMNVVLAALQEVDVEAVGLSDFGPPGAYFERQIKRWTEQYRAAETEPKEEMERLIVWLPANLPTDPGKSRLVHGDFRLDNMIFDDDGRQVLALIDWELSTLGHPYADVAYQCAQWRLPLGILRGLKGIDRKAVGLPMEELYLERFCRRRCVPMPSVGEWRFYLAVSLFRLASICQGVYKRGLEGNASSLMALEFGARTTTIAATAIEIIDPSACRMAIR